MDDATVRSTPIRVPDEALDDLARRLAETRWPEEATVEDASQGVSLAWLQDMVATWRDSYEWRRCEDRINAFGSASTTIDGVDVHFLHVRSPHPDAFPLVLTHGWPGSIVEFFDVLPMLTEPERFGGRAEDAFHVVVPSLPGYGFSGKPTAPGWTVERIGRAWAVLMDRLGYARYLAQGGDWGSVVSTALGVADPEHCVGVHLNMIWASPKSLGGAEPTADERAAFERFAEHRRSGTGYSLQQTTRPQTLGYALTDSPVGQAAWILEKFSEWTDHPGSPDAVIARERLLDDVTLYWLTASAASSARLYWESFRSVPLDEVHTPTGFTRFPKEIFGPSRRIAASRFKNLVYWNEVEAGGHFAAMEQPRLFAEEVRAFARSLLGR